MDKYLYITDCEGPVTKNDNAYEIADFFLEEGGKIFSLLSTFDDYLGLFGNIKDYRYGSTLKYIIPFFLEAKLKDKVLRDFSRKTLLITPGIKEAIDNIRKEMEVYLISTSYQHYVEEVVSYLNIKPEHAFFTKMSLDDYELNAEEKSIIQEYKKKIKTLPPIKWDKDGRLLEDSKETVKVLYEFYFYILPKLPVWNFLESIIPVGGKEKAKIISEIVKKTGVPYSNVIYIGDSITDTEAFSLVRKEGGLTLSFNGNRYAVQAAEYVIISESAVLLFDIVRRYKAYGKEGLKSIDQKGFILTERHDSEIEKMSEKMRITLRGEVIGRLG